MISKNHNYFTRANVDFKNNGWEHIPKEDAVIPIAVQKKMQGLKVTPTLKVKRSKFQKY